MVGDFFIHVYRRHVRTAFYFHLGKPQLRNVDRVGVCRTGSHTGNLTGRGCCGTDGGVGIRVFPAYGNRSQSTDPCCRIFSFVRKISAGSYIIACAHTAVFLFTFSNRS